jgi:L-aminopeptidase/D-esterase-like protein
MDGDTIFALATGTYDGAVNLDRIGALAADAVVAAILRGVRAAKSLPGYPAASEMR